ncbi:MAG: hypothetical protein IJ746_00165 [Ruminococcus sp.]|nr:hypothetical protein [Ruminococcus sp.]
MFDKLYSFFKAVVHRPACTFIFSFWLSFCFGVLYWHFGSKSNGIKYYFIAGLVCLVWTLVVINFIKLVIFTYRRVVYSSFLKRAARHGVDLELAERMKLWAEAPFEPQVRAARHLELAGILSSGGLVKRSFSILSQIDTDLLSPEGLEEYYNAYVYNNLMIGDAEAAWRVYEASKRYFDRARLRPKPMAVLHTIGVLWYSKGEYVRAEDSLLQALRSCSCDSERCDCSIYLSLTSLAEGRVDTAIDYALAASKQDPTYRQRHEITALKALIKQQAG